MFGPFRGKSEIFGCYFESLSRKAADLYESELSSVQDAFITGCIASLPPNTNFINMSFVAQRIMWARGLHHRIRSPLHYLHLHQSALLTCDAFVSVLETYAQLSCSLRGYENSLLNGWVVQVEKNLNGNIFAQPLLRLTDRNGIAVNFDEEWFDMFETTKLLTSIGCVVPEPLKHICTNRDNVYTMRCSLQAVVFMYNSLFDGIERDPVYPLMIHKFKNLREMAVPGLERLCWGSHGADVFVSKLHRALVACSHLLEQVKGKVGFVVNSVTSCCQHHLFGFNLQRTFPLAELHERATFHIERMCAAFSASMLTIQSEMDSIMILVGANSTMPEWKRFAEYLWGLIRKFLKSFIVDELNYLKAHLEGQKCESSEFMSCPLIETKLELDDSVGEIIFVPKIDCSVSNTGIINVAMGWMSSIVGLICKIQGCMRKAEMDEVASDCDVLMTQESIKSILMKLQSETSLFSMKFSVFAFLWDENEKNNYQDMFKNLDIAPWTTFPDMNHFEHVVLETEMLNSSLQHIEDTFVVSCLRIDARKIKSSILINLQDRVDSHISWLISFTRKRIDEIEGFVRAKRVELKFASDTCMEQNDINPLLMIMQTIRLQGKHIEESFEPLNKIIAFVITHVKRKDEDLALKLTNLMALWADLQKFILQVKELYYKNIKFETEKLEERESILQTLLANAQLYFERAKLNAVDEEKSIEEITLNAYNSISECKVRIDSVVDEKRKLDDYAELLHCSVPGTKVQANMLFCELTKVKKLWDIISFVLYTLEFWNEKKWKDVNCDMYSEIINEIEGHLQCIKEIDEGLAELPAFFQISEKVLKVRQSISSLFLMQGSAIRSRHWKQIFRLANKSANYSEQLCLKEIVAIELYVIHDEVVKISEIAIQEQMIEMELEKVENRWRDWQLSCCLSEHCRVPLLEKSFLEKAIIHLQEEQIFLQTIQSKHFLFLSKNIDILQKKLATLEFALTSLIEIQSSLMKNTFYISKGKSSNFDNTKTYQQIKQSQQEILDFLHKLSQNTHVSISTFLDPPFLNKVIELKYQLSCDEKALSGWLASKREKYSRFYFLSDSELFHLFSSGSESPKRFMHLFTKMFEGIHSLQFASRAAASGNEVQGAIGFGQEYLPFESEVAFVQDMELDLWFLDITNQV